MVPCNKIDDENPKKPPTPSANSSFQQKKLDHDPESNYKDFKSENTGLPCLISLQQPPSKPHGTHT